MAAMLMRIEEILLRLPDGKSIVDPTPDEIIEMLDTTKPSFWERGSGDVGIERKTESDFERLVIIGKEPHGFYIQHSDSNPSDPYIAIEGEDYSIRTKVIVGGEPWIIPVAFFVDSKGLRAAIGEFCETGKREVNLKWVKLWKQDWNADETTD
jgi:hypothetical protein